MFKVRKKGVGKPARESFENALALVRSVMLLLLCPTLGGDVVFVNTIPTEPNELCR